MVETGIGHSTWEAVVAVPRSALQDRCCVEIWCSRQSRRSVVGGPTNLIALVSRIQHSNIQHSTESGQRGRWEFAQPGSTSFLSPGSLKLLIFWMRTPRRDASPTKQWKHCSIHGPWSCQFRAGSVTESGLVGGAAARVAGPTRS